MAIGDKLKLKRETLGLTQSDMAKMLDVERSHYFKWESGEKNPSLDSITHIAKTLDVSFDFLLNDECQDVPRISNDIGRYLKKTAKGYVCTAERCEWRKDGFCPGIGCMKEDSRSHG